MRTCSNDTKLYELCKKFIEDNKISEQSQCYKYTDKRITANLLIDICETIGYYDYGPSIGGWKNYESDDA